MILNNPQDFGTIVNGHNTLVQGVHNYIHSTNARLATLDQQTAGQGEKIHAMTSDMAALKTAQANTDAALRAENEALKHQLTEVTARLDTQKRESDTEIRQLKTSLQNLTLANQEMLQQLTRLTSRFNVLDTPSNSFFSSITSHNEDRTIIDEELSSALSELDVSANNQ